MARRRTASDGIVTSLTATVTIDVARGLTLRYASDITVALGAPAVTLVGGDVVEDDQGVTEAVTDRLLRAARVSDRSAAVSV